jgi:hypothetical protein
LFKNYSRTYVQAHFSLVCLLLAKLQVGALLMSAWGMVQLKSLASSLFSSASKLPRKVVRIESVAV